MAGAALHRRWRARRTRPGPPSVLVVGSLRSGGSAKTDLVAHLARLRPDLAILVHPTGDEDRMLEARFPGRVFAHRDLLEARARSVAAGFVAAVSDGGLQDPALDGCPAARLDHAPGPAGPQDLLPFGRFRALDAPAREREAVLVVGRDLTWRLEPASLPGKGSRVAIACGIARPEAFLADLRAAGLEVEEEVRVGDHGRFPAGLLRRMELDPPRWCVTEKDAFRQRLPAGTRVVRRELVLSDPARRALADLLDSLPGLAG